MNASWYLGEGNGYSKAHLLTVSAFLETWISSYEAKRLMISNDPKKIIEAL
jgi:hypothetical protein